MGVINRGWLKPHIKLLDWGGIWWWTCAMQGISGTGVGYNPAAAWDDWHKWVYQKAVGHEWGEK
ncbi:MAG TPA: hypothetical protein VIY48_06100 [Candidatus Paceibacterota bacterium]